MVEKEENIDLNDHIYSIDVFMREKEQQSEQLQKDKEQLLGQIGHLQTQLAESNNKLVNAADQSREQQTVVAVSSDSMSAAATAATTDYGRFLSQLHSHIGKKTRALADFVKLVHSLSNHLSSCGSDVDQASILAHIDSGSGLVVDKSPTSSGLLDALKLLLQSSELHQFNAQIVSYMGEQLIHKAALNGYLKFACDLLRKKLV